MEDMPQPEELQLGDSFARILTETTQSLVCVMDREGRIRLFNEACERATGYTRGEVLGRHARDFVIPSEEREAFDAQSKKLLKQLNAAIKSLHQAEEVRNQTLDSVALSKRAKGGMGALGRWAAGGAVTAKSPQEEAEEANFNEEGDGEEEDAADDDDDASVLFGLLGSLLELVVRLDEEAVGFEELARLGLFEVEHDAPLVPLPPAPLCPLPPPLPPWPLLLTDAFSGLLQPSVVSTD